LNGGEIMGIWNAEYECMDREKLMELQGYRLRKTVERVYNNVPHYRQKMKDKGIEPGDIKSVHDIHKLPLTYKQDLRDTYP
jgi:phenylacetate-CoA ligase